MGSLESTGPSTDEIRAQMREEDAEIVGAEVRPVTVLDSQADLALLTREPAASEVAADPA